MKNFWNFLRSKVFLINIGLALLAIVVLSVIALQWLKKSTNHGEFIEVPDLSKLSVMEMRVVIEDANLRYEVLDSANFNPDYTRFSIIEQDPQA